MDLVIDANIIFAALIKESYSYHFLFEQQFQLFAPEYLLEEIETHSEELLQKTQRTPKEFFEVLEILKRMITFVPLEKLVPYLEQAEEISPDKYDLAYFALALKLNCAIWSNDKEMKEKQNKIKVYSTHELIQL